MALPTVRYYEAGAGADSATLDKWMTKLHDLLIAADWTIEYADSDAIGSGSGSDPAWDKAPEVNADAGIVVYRMPANGHATQWYVRLRPGWAAATARPHMRGIQVGTSHASGTLSGSVSTEAVAAVSTTATDALAWQMATSEDGLFFLTASASAAPVVYLERLRNEGDTTVDDVAFGNTFGAGQHRLVSAASGQMLDTPPAILARNDVPSIVAQADSVIGRNSVDVVAIGPYFRAGYPLWGIPRLWFQAVAADSSPDAYRTRTVDGGAKAYRTAPAAVGGQTTILVATE